MLRKKILSKLEWIKGQQRTLLLLPVLVLPFLVGLFAALKSGHERDTPSGLAAQAHGLNLGLPDPHLAHPKPEDKWSLYQRRRSDSLSIKNQNAGNPLDSSGLGKDTDLAGETGNDARSGSSLAWHREPSPFLKNDSTLAQLDSRLQRLNQQLEKKAGTRTVPGPEKSLFREKAEPSAIDSLNALARSVQAASSQPDPELGQLNGMLDKILSIQDRVAGRYPENPKTSSTQGENHLESPEIGKGFRTSDAEKFNNLQADAAPIDGPDKSLFEAEIPFSQSILPGSAVRLRMKAPVKIQQHLLPAGTLVSGIASVSGQRLNILVNGILEGSIFLKVSLEALDLDGIAGIRIPSRSVREAAQSSVSESIGAVPMLSLEGNAASTAAGAGVQALRSLVARKIRQQKILLPAGYRLWLKDKVSPF